MASTSPPARSRPEFRQTSFDDLGTPLTDITFCVIDLETTGASPSECAITEVAAAKFRGGECVGTLQTLVNPGVPIPPQITYLTGITQMMVVPAPRIEAVLPSLLEFSRNTVIVGHNVRFDLSFLDAALLAHDWPRLPRAQVVDTLRLARRLLRDDVRDCKLGTLAYQLRLPHQPTHRALDDVLATADLLHLLLERAAGLGVLGIDDLVDLPTVGRHPQAAKLRLTTALPRRPGVYLFRSGDGEVLYVGKATDLRSRVRSYFGRDDRRKIGPLLTELQRIMYVECPTPFEAAVLEVRLIQKLLPRYNRVSTRWSSYCYVRMPSRSDGKFVVTPQAIGPAPHLGPFPSRGMARLAVVALEEALRGRRVDPVELALLRPAELLEPLHARMRSLAATEAFEQAAALRDRAGALMRALDRQHRCGALEATGHLDVRVAGHRYAFQHGRLHLEHLSTSAVGIQPPRTPRNAPCYPHALPALDREVIDELALAAAFLDNAGRRARIEACAGQPLTRPITRIPRFEPLPSRQ